MLILFFSCLSYLLTIAQQENVYYIIHLQGVIINQTNKDTLQVGDKIYASDKLVFKSAGARATVLSTKKGRFTIGLPIASKTNASSAGGELITLLKNVLMPEKATERLSTKGLEVEKIVDLRSVFMYPAFVFPGEHAKLLLDPTAHSLSPDQFFMYRYIYDSDKTARKKIPFSGDTLIFDKKILYMVNGKAVYPEKSTIVEIHKVNGAQGNSMLIARFTPLFIPDKQLKEELQVICSVVEADKLSEAALFEQLYQHVTATYGQTDKNMLKMWVNEHLGL